MCTDTTITPGAYTSPPINKRQSSSPRLVFPPSKGTSWNGGHSGNSLTLRLIVSRSFLTQQSWLIFNRLSRSPAGHGIEGLSGRENNYHHAITTLQERYNRPRLLHQTHACAIVEAVSLKDRSGKELHCLHDVLTQHLQRSRQLTMNRVHSSQS